MGGMADVRSPEYQRMLKKLRQARKDARLTQAQAGQAMGVRQTVISKIEKGDRKIDPFELRALALKYGKNMEHFLDD